jgi:hypothetical protein
MKNLVFIISIFLFAHAGAQPPVLIHGNQGSVCLSDTLHPSSLLNMQDLDSNRVLFIFSSAGNGYTKEQLDSLETFVLNGGGLYIGAENWPLQTEANQITDRLFHKNAFGFYCTEIAETADNGNLALKDMEQIPSGKTSVAFPLDHRLTVEAWVQDQPLLLSGYHGKGRIVLDGGYSRFYCDQITTESKKVILQIFNFLNGD